MHAVVDCVCFVLYSCCYRVLSGCVTTTEQTTDHVLLQRRGVLGV
jgi:hypothetical protein